MNFKLWLSLLAMLLIPSIYTTLRVFFLNAAPDTSNVSIAAQSVWLGLIYEVLAEALIVPLFFIFGQVVQQVDALRQRIGVALGCSTMVYAIVTTVVWVMTDSLVTAMQQTPAERALAAGFIRVEALALMVGVVNDVCLVVLTTLAMHRWILALVLLRAMLMVVLDTALVSQLPWSLQLGVQGVALANLCTAVMLCSVSLVLLHRIRLLSWSTHTLRAPWFKAWWRIASYSGIEVALRNGVYAWVILRLINQTGGAPLYWNANQIIWGWLLLPVLALGQLVRQDAATSQGDLQGRWKSYAAVMFLCAVAWWALTPIWDAVIQQVLGVSDSSPVRSVLQQLLPFYAVFAVLYVLQSFLYGLGRTDLILWQSLVVNVLYYGVVVSYVQLQQISPTVSDVVWIFGCGMCAGLLVMLWQVQKSGYWQLMGMRGEEQNKPSQVSL